MNEDVRKIQLLYEGVEDPLKWTRLLKTLCETPSQHLIADALHNGYQLSLKDLFDILDELSHEPPMAVKSGMMSIMYSVGDKPLRDDLYTRIGQVTDWFAFTEDIKELHQRLQDYATDDADAFGDML